MLEMPVGATNLLRTIRCAPLWRASCWIIDDSTERDRAGLSRIAAAGEVIGQRKRTATVDSEARRADRHTRTDLARVERSTGGLVDIEPALANRSRYKRVVLDCVPALARSAADRAAVRSIRVPVRQHQIDLR